jgi:hypothetical protein
VRLCVTDQSRGKDLSRGSWWGLPEIGSNSKRFCNRLDRTKATSQTIVFVVSLITNLPLLKVQLLSNMIIPQKEICFVRKLSEMNKGVDRGGGFLRLGMLVTEFDVAVFDYFEQQLFCLCIG